MKDWLSRNLTIPTVKAQNAKGCLYRQAGRRGRAAVYFLRGQAERRVERCYSARAVPGVRSAKTGEIVMIIAGILIIVVFFALWARDIEGEQ